MSSNCKSVPLKIVAPSSEMIPRYQTCGAAGADLMACIDVDVVIEPGRSALIGTGIFLEVPSGYEVQIRSRSGLACQHQVCVLNSPGTIDSDYRGEIKVILMNHGEDSFTVKPKMRIAQMVLSPVVQACFVSVQELQETKRGNGGFGHTGIQLPEVTGGLALVSNSIS
jgi:dUTP pyrophosphatase